MMVWRIFPAGIVCDDSVPDSVKSSTNMMLCDQLKCLCGTKRVKKGLRPKRVMVLKSGENKPR